MATQSATLQDFQDLAAQLTKLTRATGINPHDLVGRYILYAGGQTPTKTPELLTSTVLQAFPELKSGGTITGTY